RRRRRRRCLGSSCYGPGPQSALIIAKHSARAAKMSSSRNAGIRCARLKNGAGNRDIDGQNPRGSGRAAGEAASQSAYWLELLVESGVVGVEKLGSLRQKCEELTAIFVTILKRAKTS